MNRKNLKASLNAILVYNILHLIDNTPMVMRRINQLLKPGGVFISSTPCLGEKKSVLNGIISLVSRKGIIPNVNFISMTELEETVIKSGFQIIESEKSNDTAKENFIVAQKTE